MKHTFVPILALLFFSSVPAQFADELALGPSVDYLHSGKAPVIRLNMQLHIPGDYVDIEACPFSVAVMPDGDLVKQYGVTWLSLLAVPPFLLREKSGFMKTLSTALMGVNAVTNANISAGGSWVRGFLGWRNDLFLFRGVAWLCRPVLGCKVALPQSRHTNMSLRAGVTSPLILSSDGRLRNRPFRPGVFASWDVYLLFGKVWLGSRGPVQTGK